MAKTSVLGEQYVSARATPKLVGHLKARDQIHKAIRDDTRSYLVYIYGPGGIGKTWLIRDILESPPKGSNILCAKQLIDLYHIRNNSVSGLIDSLFDALPGFKTVLKSELREKYPLKADLESDGLSLAEIIVQCDLNFFSDTLNKFRKGRRLILAFDTAEKLFFARDRIQEKLIIQNFVPRVISWLSQVLIPNLDNIVLVIAGRPENYLRNEFRKIKTKKFLPIELKSLSLKESLDYFEAVVAAAKNDKKNDTALYLSKITLQERLSIISYLRKRADKKNGVRPILLSLAIDYLAHHNCNVKDLLALLMQDASSTDGFETKLVNSFIDGGRDADDLILIMAMIPKGIDDKLLGYLYSKGLINVQDVDNLLVSLSDLSFVKFRHKDKRVFLHDEMLEMIRKVDKRHSRVREIQTEVVNFYEESIEENRKMIVGDFFDVKSSSEFYWRQLELQVEHLHYLLALNPIASLDTYYKYMEHAQLSKNEGMYLQLRAELLAHLKETFI